MSALSRDVVVVGASAGGVEALRAVVAGLPADLPASVLVVLHLPANGTSALPAILTRAGSLPAIPAADGEVPRHGRVYVAPPDRHLLLSGERMALSSTPPRGGHRPAIDVLFQSAAVTFGRRVVGVVLSGSMHDGVDGLNAVREHGGVTMVQHRLDASYPGMPESVLRVMTPDRVLPAAAIGPALAEYAGVQPGQASPASDEVPGEPAVLRVDSEWREQALSAVFTCPACSAPLVDLGRQAALICRAGHRWDTETLLEAKGVSFEQAARMAVRVFQERVSLARRLESGARSRGQTLLQERYGRQSQDAARSLDQLRTHLEAGRCG